MDRRQKKTKNAIFDAFIELLNKKEFSKISVQEIIDEADVGRATFYQHFETKDYLLKELCEELFSHIIHAEEGETSLASHYSECQRRGSVFLHLFEHLEKNDDNLLKLLSSQNNEIFILYFKHNLKRLIEKETEFANKSDKILPHDFLIEHISSTFVNTVMWWIKGGKKESSERMVAYFYTLLDGIIK